MFFFLCEIHTHDSIIITTTTQKTDNGGSLKKQNDTDDTNYETIKSKLTIEEMNLGHKVKLYLETEGSLLISESSRQK